MIPTPSEIALLVKFVPGHVHLRDGKATPAIQSLIDRGYCSVFTERHGPVGGFTRHVNIQLTEAGRFALACLVLVAEITNTKEPKPTS